MRETGVMGRRMVEPGEDAREGPRIVRNPIRHDPPRKIGESARIAVGVQDQAASALGLQARHHPIEQGAPAEVPQGLVASAHAPGQAPGQDQAKDRRNWDQRS
jgi:hypothetical protein